MIKKNIYIFITVLISFCTALSQDDSLDYTVKPYFEYMVIHHEPKFDKIPEIQYCCQSRSDINSGKGWGTGIKYELSLPYSLCLGLKVGYSQFSADMASPETKAIRIDDSRGTLKVRHYNNSQFGAIFISTYLKLNLIDNVSIFIGGFAAPFISKTYGIYEKIISPEGYIYKETGKDTRNYQKQDYKSDKGLWGGVNFGLAYDLYLFKNLLYLTPEINYNMGLNSIISSVDWQVNSLNFAINMGLNLHSSPKIKNIRTIKNQTDTVYYNNEHYANDFRQGIEKIDSVKYKNNNIIETIITISRVDTVFRGKKYDVSLNMKNQDLFVEIRKVDQEFQNLDIVFFKNNSDELTDNYNKLHSKGEFIFENIKPSPLDIHYNILNIIGYRLSAYPNTEITLEGNTDSLNPTELVNTRIKNITKYLAEVWNIDNSRIKAKIRPARPINAKNKNDRRYIEENNRIKITSKDVRIFAPIKKINFDEIKSYSPDKLVISVNGINDIGLKNYQIMLYQDKNIIQNINSDNRQDSFVVKITDSLINTINLNKPIEAAYIAELSEGKKIVANDSIMINKKLLKEKISRLALIFFDFDSDIIQENSLAQINELTKYITPTSIVKIKGYTDDIGTEEYNKKLSLNRAKNVANLITKYNSKAKIQSVEGLGSEVYTKGINSFDSPIERYLSRTVVIEVFDEIK